MLKRFACYYVHNERLWSYTITARNWQDAERAAALKIPGSWVAGEIVHTEDASDELVRAVKKARYERN